jgi:PQQ-dependent catabolism-associated CXXCW motif protein
MTTIRLGAHAAALALAALAAVPAMAQDSFGQASQGGAPQAFPQGQQPFPQGGQPFPQGQQQGPAGGPSAGGFGSPGFGAPPAQNGPANLDQLMQVERQDFGVAATKELHAGQMHGPTPASIPGGQVITTKGLVELMRGQQAPVLLLDVLGGPEIIQGAQYAVPAAQPGSFNDQTQQQLSQYLEQATQGSKQYPIVLYCLSPQCWMSYNAALRAINLGYTNVLWYRGGIESWKQAGMPVQRVQ